MADFDLNARHDGAITIISIQGDLDMDSAPVLAAAASTELASPDCTQLILDVTDLEFLDSTGLGCWVDLHKRATAAGKTLRIENLPEDARRIVHITGLSKLFDLSQS